MKDKWQQLNWKKKNLIFCMALVAFVWMAYKCAIARTLELAGECEAYQQQIDSSETIARSIAGLELQLDSMNQRSREFNYVSHEELLGVVSGYCAVNGIKLRDFPEVMRINKDARVLEIHCVTVEGEFAELVLLAEHLRNTKTGRVVALNFAARIDNKTKVRSLTATFYIQCIKNKAS